MSFWLVKPCQILFRLVCTFSDLFWFGPFGHDSLLGLTFSYFGYYFLAYSFDLCLTLSEMWFRHVWVCVPGCSGFVRMVVLFVVYPLEAVLNFVRLIRLSLDRLSDISRTLFKLLRICVWYVSGMCLHCSDLSQIVLLLFPDFI